MTTSFTSGKFRETDANGDPLAGGLLYTYATGTLTPLATYTDYGGGSPNTNPIVLDSAGRANIWLGSSAYRMILKAPDGSTVWDLDPILSIGSPNGSSIVGFLQSGTGATPRTVQDKLRETQISVTDFFLAGEADSTAMIARALTAGVNRRLIFPAGTYVTTGNEIPSNSHLIFERGAILRVANGANRPALQNVNFQKAGWGGATYGLDTNITIEGLYLDGNQASQAHTGSGIYAGEYTSGIRLGGVTNLTLRDITVYQARTFGIWLYAIYNLTVHNVRFDQYMGGTPDNQDGLHVNGPATYVDIRNIRGTTNDDMIALNADDGALGSNVTTGAITNAIIDGVYPAGCLNGVRLLSATSRMDQITVRSVKGSTRDVAVNQSPFGLGAGNVGTLTIEDIDVRCSNPYQPTSSNYYAVIALEGIIESVSIRNVKNNRPADNRPTVLVPGTANIGVLNIDGLSIFEAAGSTLTGVKPVFVLGLIDTLSISNVWYFRDSTLTQTGNLLLIGATGHGVTNLSCSNWTVERLSNPVGHSDGLLGNVSLSGINDRNGLPGGALLALASATASTTNILGMQGCNTDFGRQLVTRSGSSVYGSRTTIDNCGTSGASASLTGNQALGAGAYTKANFAVVNFDRVTGEYSAANQQFTVSQGPGEYLISVGLDLTIPTNPTDITVALYKAGVIYRAFPGSQRFFTNALAGGSMTVSVAQGDVFDIRVFVSANATLNNTSSTVVFYERLK